MTMPAAPQNSYPPQPVVKRGLSGGKLALSLFAAWLVGVLSMIAFAFAIDSRDPLTSEERARLQETMSRFDSPAPVSSSAFPDPVSSSPADKLGSETLSQYGVDISAEKFGEVAPLICDEYDAGGDLAAAQAVVENNVQVYGWKATKVVQMAVTQRCSKYADLTY